MENTIKGIRGFDSEDFIETNEVHVYGSHAAAFFRAMEPKPEGIEFVYHRPGNFVIEHLDREELEFVTQKAGIVNMMPAQANSEGKIMTGDPMDDDQIMNAIIGHDVTVSMAGGMNEYLLCATKGDMSTYYVAEFHSFGQVPVRGRENEAEYGIGADGLFWNGSPWSLPVEWTVRYNDWAENPCRDDQTVAVFDARDSDIPGNWRNATGVGNISKGDVYEELELDDYEDDYGVIVKAMEAKGWHHRPLYMYSHSGETIRTTPFSDRWDSGMIGFCFIREPKGMEDPDAEIIQTVERIDLWMNGQSYTLGLEIDDDEVDTDFVTMDFDDAVTRAREYASDFIHRGDHIVYMAHKNARVEA